MTNKHGVEITDELKCFCKRQNITQDDITHTRKDYDGETLVGVNIRNVSFPKSVEEEMLDVIKDIREYQKNMLVDMTYIRSAVDMLKGKK